MRTTSRKELFFKGVEIRLKNTIKISAKIKLKEMSLYLVSLTISVSPSHIRMHTRTHTRIHTRTHTHENTHTHAYTNFDYLIYIFLYILKLINSQSSFLNRNHEWGQRMGKKRFRKILKTQIIFSTPAMEELLVQPRQFLWKWLLILKNELIERNLRRKILFLKLKLTMMQDKLAAFKVHIPKRIRQSWSFYIYYKYKVW